MNAVQPGIIANIYTTKEGFKNVHPWFNELKQQGLDPDFISMDGEISVIRAIKATWRKTKVQRCLYHIQREGMRWLRSHPKTLAGKELRQLLSTLTDIKSIKERNEFIRLFRHWIRRYYNFVQSLPTGTVAFKDLKRTIASIHNALPNMFHYLKNPSVPATTNALESFYSRLKADYQRHRGLSETHKISYLKWYCYYKNTNTL